MNLIRQFLESLRALLKNVRALAIFAGLYALLLVTFYIFIATREATVWQVLITYAFLVLIPAEFFLLQSAVLKHAREGKFLWPQIVRGAIKLFVATIPIVLIALVFWALLDKFQLHYPAPKAALAESLRDRKSTRLNSSHVATSYAVFCLKKKNITKQLTTR